MHFPPWNEYIDTNGVVIRTPFEAGCGLELMDTAFRFKDWTIRMEKADGYWRAEGTKWLNSDWATGKSPEDALQSLAKKMGWDAQDLAVAWMSKS